MPLYRVHRIKQAAGETFRWAPHTGGLAYVKPKDYELVEELEGSNPYAAWQRALSEGRRLRPGDLLEAPPPEDIGTASPAQLWVTKYVGLEPAQWHIPEPKPTTASSVELLETPAD